MEKGSGVREENSPSIRDVPFRKNLFKGIAPFTQLLMLKYRPQVRPSVVTLLS
jgi:hypothetical protein